MSLCGGGGGGGYGGGVGRGMCMSYESGWEGRNRIRIPSIRSSSQFEPLNPLRPLKTAKASRVSFIMIG